MAATVLRARLIACVVGLLTVAVGRPAAAETLNLAWDPSPNTSVVGYVVYVRIPGPRAIRTTSAIPRPSRGPAPSRGSSTIFPSPPTRPGPFWAAFGGDSPLSEHGAIALRPGTAIVGCRIDRLAGVDRKRSGGWPLTYGASGLPAGLQVGAATGAITGSPLATGPTRLQPR
jgi:hypothetical protein